MVTIHEHLKQRIRSKEHRRTPHEEAKRLFLVYAHDLLQEVVFQTALKILQAIKEPQYEMRAVEKVRNFTLCPT
jgi:hypothetical protein